MPRPRPTKKVSVNVANINARGNSTNANMRITRSRYNTINLEDSIAIRNSNTTNVIMRIVEDNISADNNTINLEDSTAIEVDVDTQDDEDEGGNGGGVDNDVVDLTEGQDSQAPVSTSMISRTPRRQLPQAVMAN